jgi:hypothetical protein
MKLHYNPKTKMNQIKILAVVCLAAGSLVSCSQDDDIALGSKLVGTDAVTIASFPAYNIESNSRASSIGTTDAGKTAWADGDVVYLKVSVSEHSTIYTLTYESGSWEVPTIVISPDSYSDKVTYTAYYAPNYELKSDGTLGLKGDKTVGTAEYLKYESSEINYLDFTGFNIAFSRNYSRLRVACDDSSDVSFSFTGFTPVDGEVAENYVITPDENGNAYLYGSWTADSKIEFGESPVDGIVYGYKISTASSEGKSYAIRSNTATIYLNELGSFDNACAALKTFATNQSSVLNYKIVGEHDYFYNSNSKESIFYNAGNYYTTIKTLDLSSCINMTVIGEYEFDTCKSLTNIILPTDNKITSIGYKGFYDCKSLMNVIIPNDVTTIGSCAFCNCSALTEISIPASVTSIGSSAFKGCSSLIKVVCNVTNTPNIMTRTINGTSYGTVFPTSSSSRYLYVPSGSLSKYKNSNYGWTEYFSDSNIIKIEE